MDKIAITTKLFTTQYENIKITLCCKGSQKTTTLLTGSQLI